MKALLFIGLQVDLLPLGAAEIPESEKVIPVINRLLPHFGHLAAANFSLPANHKMFVANYPWRRPGQVLDLMGEKILLKHYFCIKGSFGAEHPMNLNQEKIHFTALMGTDHQCLPHSAFFGKNKKRDTGLNAHFQKNKIKKLYLAGLNESNALVNTAADAIEMGYQTAIIEDATKGPDQQNLGEALIKLKKMGADILSSEDVLAELKK
ncbi:MAG TPA: isochorismatase family protein [Bacteroidetes bacterium]|nr:isochorismatase family protein [Bacteroidota bacterium]